jgi:hypothetical protein
MELSAEALLAFLLVFGVLEPPHELPYFKLLRLLYFLQR